MFAAMDFWFDLGVDGLRLDAVPYLFEREGTNCENLPETHTALKELRKHVDEKYEGRMLLAEANQWPEDAVAYFGNGDECHMAFHFPIMPRLFMALRMEDRHPITEILRITPPIPENCQWAMFLRNHDELTLEMVTDEERDYMYRTYAQDRGMRINLGIRRRLAPLLENDRRRIELMNALLLSLPGTPVLYYGDEIGMGDNIYLGDRNGVRTPMQWSPDRNAGFSRADPQRLYLPPIMDPVYGYQAVNVEAQERDPGSLLNWTKRMLRIRRESRAFGRGRLAFLNPGNRKVLPSLLTLPAHAFYWFRLASDAEGPSWHTQMIVPDELPILVLFDGWVSFFSDRVVPWRIRMAEQLRKRLEEEVLPRYIQAQRWYASKGELIREVRLQDHAVWEVGNMHGNMSGGGISWLLTILDVGKASYFLPLALAWEEDEEHVGQLAQSTIVRVRQQANVGVVGDAMADEGFCRNVVKAIGESRSLAAGQGSIRFAPTEVFRRIAGEDLATLAVGPLQAQSTNTSVTLSERLFLKCYRNLRPGVNPELEVGRFLTETAEFGNCVPVAGAGEYVSEEKEPVTLALLQAYVPTQGDGWSYTQEYLRRWLETQRGAPEASHASYLLLIQTLATRTAELHRALATPSRNPAFTPEPLTSADVEAWKSRVKEEATQTLAMVDRNSTPLKSSHRRYT